MIVANAFLALTIMRIFLLRHGATEWNLQGRCQGATDLELSEIGRRQAEEMATTLSHERIHAVYSSNLKRAIQTAGAISQLHNLTLVIEDSLRELDQGELEGLTLSEIQATRPDFIRQWRDRPAELPIPGGERLIDVDKRVWDGMRGIARRHRPDETVVVVSHQFPILAVLCRITETPLDRYRSFRLDPCGVIRLSYHADDEWRVMAENGKLPLRQE